MRIIQPTAILVLLSASFATSTKLRGSGNTSRIRGTTKQKQNNNQRNNDERFLVEDDSDVDDPNKRPGNNSDFRNPNSKKNKRPKNSLTTRPQATESPEDFEQSRFDSGAEAGEGAIAATTRPTQSPNSRPTPDPTPVPSNRPTPDPTPRPTHRPTPTPSARPTPRPTVIHTRRPTSFPTWTFPVAEPQIIEEAQFVCEYCPHQCVFTNAVVEFPNGGSVTCSKIREIAPSLRSYQCEANREVIEEACCCQGYVAELHPSAPSAPESRMIDDDDDTTCDVCAGEQVLNDQIINLSNGEMVSCSGFMDLVQNSGLPGSFCESERTSIEKACCPSWVGETEIEPPAQPEGRITDNDVPAAEIGMSTCNVCAGQQILNDQIINLSNGEMVSCGGFMDLVRTGLPEVFCESERISIEKACCPSWVGETEIEPPAQLEGRITDNDVPAAEIGMSTCNVCAGQQILNDQIINLSNGEMVSCGGFMDLVRTGLPEVFCESERTSIEEACCPSNNAVPKSIVVESPVQGRLDFDEIDADSAAESPVEVLAAVDMGPCNFCGGEFLSEPTIYFSSGNDEVSCKGFLDLLQMGLPSEFCERERSSIEEACCQPKSVTMKDTGLFKGPLKSRQIDPMHRAAHNRVNLGGIRRGEVVGGNF